MFFCGFSCPLPTNTTFRAWGRSANFCWSSSFRLTTWSTTSSRLFFSEPTTSRWRPWTSSPKTLTESRRLRLGPSWWRTLTPLKLFRRLSNIWQTPRQLNYELPIVSLKVCFDICWKMSVLSHVIRNKISKMLEISLLGIKIPLIYTIEDFTLLTFSALTSVSF